MKHIISMILVGTTLLSATAFAATGSGTWSPDRKIKAVQVADACGTVTGQYAVITDSTDTLYWITSNADNFNNVVAMAQAALINSRTVNFYYGSESYTVSTQLEPGNCWTSSTAIPKKLAILNIK